MVKDTIAAIATGLSNSGISIIRISGPQSFEIANKIFKSKKGTDISEMKSHTVHYGDICDGNDIVDEVLLIIMKAPNTYTKEDIVEIDCHGGIFVTRKILDLVIKNGARTAEPGEFTKRAFLNGRIDLSQAEAVTDIINSKNDYALKGSVNMIEGRFSTKIKKIREDLLYNIAYIESALDDPEHYSLDNYVDKLIIIVENSINTVNKLLITANNGKLLTQGIKSVILGKPNAGKSSLLNVLVGSDRAIVTDIPGTTRDIIEEEINIDGMVLKLADTAGIRETNNLVEKIGVDKAMESARDADLILYVIDSSEEISEEDKNILEQIRDFNVIILLNKSDLKQKVTSSDIAVITDKKVINISAKENAGIDELSETLKKMFIEGKVNYNDELYMIDARKKELLQNTIESLKLVMKSIEDKMPEDFYTIDLMNAYEELGKIIGESVEEDLVNEIFSKFCMGK